MRALVQLIVGCIAAVLAAGLAAAQTREALVIANRDYAQGVGRLANTHEDADLVAAGLRGVGFRVRVVKEADRLTVLAELRDHATRVAAGGQGAIGLFYYSGHGAADEDTGRNFLIPIDVASTASATLWDASIPVSEIQRRLSQGAPGANHFIIFDACRNELQLPFRDASKGFVPEASAGGMFISFSTAPGLRASDGDPGDVGGPFARAFAEELAKGGAGRDATAFFEDVRFNVRDKTNRTQLPWQVNGLPDRVYPFGDAATQITVPTTTNAPPSLEVDLFDRAQTPCEYAAFVETYPNSPYAALARVRAQDCPSSTPARDPTTPPAASSATHDITQLHPDVRIAAERARDYERRAEDAAASARAAAQRAEDAARRARAGEDGYSVRTYDDGDRYEGQFSDGRRTGYGVYYHLDEPFAGDVYAGQFDGEGRFGGAGVYTFAANPNNAGNSRRYEGEWADDQRNGLGVYYWMDGDRRAGGNRDSLGSGPLVYRFADGRRYEGEYLEGRRGGYGVAWDPQGRVESSGIWTDGQLTTTLAP